MMLIAHVTKPIFFIKFLDHILQAQLILLHIWYGESVCFNSSYCSQSIFLKYICGWFFLACRSIADHNWSRLSYDLWSVIVITILAITDLFSVDVLAGIARCKNTVRFLSQAYNRKRLFPLNQYVGLIRPYLSLIL